MPPSPAESAPHRNRRRLIALFLLAVAAAAFGPLQAQAAPASAATASYGWVTTVLINNTAKSWKVYDPSTPPCLGWPEWVHPPIVRDRWTTPPPAAAIRPNDVVSWGAASNRDNDDFAGSKVLVCSEDPAKQGVELSANSFDGDMYLLCTSVFDPALCQFQEADKASHTAYFRLGPKVSPRVSLDSPGVFSPGVLVTLTAQLGSPGAGASSSVPRTTMSFDLGTNGTGNCSSVPVVAGKAVCQATFTGTADQQVRVTYAGDIQYTAGSADTTLSLGRDLVSAPYYPSSGSGWEAGGKPFPYPDDQNLPGIPWTIASSADGTASAAVSSAGQLYGRYEDVPGFRPVRGNETGPMNALAAAVDTTGDGSTHFAAIGWDREVWYKTVSPFGAESTWSTPSPGWRNVKDLAMSIDSLGRSHVVAVDMSNNVYYRIRYADGTWSPSWDQVRLPGGAPVQASSVAVSADASTTSGTGSVELDFVGYGNATIESRVFAITKPQINAGWTSLQPILVSPQGVFVDVAAGRARHVIGTTTTDVGVVAATTGDNAPIERVLRTGTTWSQQAVAKTDSGYAGLAVGGTPDRKGIGITTWQ